MPNTQQGNKSTPQGSAAKSSEFTLVWNFDKGYRNREDDTILPPGILVKGSKNVVTNVNGRIAVRKGYTLDGQANLTVTPITSSFDWTKIFNNDTHVRSFGTQLQFRYLNPVTNLITWQNVATGFANSNFTYVPWWDTTELTTVMVFVNGTTNMYEWSGGVASFASATVNTITKSGTTTWAQEGFYTAGVRQVNIGGITYTYTGGENTTTLTGVAPDPTLGGHAVGDAVSQTIRTFVVATFPGVPATFLPYIIGNLTSSNGEQVYLGASKDSNVYVSRSQNYRNYTQVTGGPRKPGDGAIKTITGYPTAFINQDEDMYLSVGKDVWYKTDYEQTTTSVFDAVTGLTVNTVYETLDLLQLKTTVLQGAQSQTAMTKIKNNILYLSFEPIVNTFGPVENVYQNPQISDISSPIVNDMDAYDFTDASMVYFRQFAYLSVPKEGLVRVFNMTDPNNHYWEAPLTIPVARFSIIDDALYGHSYQVPETYKLFDGYADNRNPIPAVARFSFNNFGNRSYQKDFNQMYVEGYINSNCELTLGIQYEVDGCSTDTQYELRGDNAQYVCIGGPDNSFGKQPFGKFPFGGLFNLTSSTDLPPKFRVIQTFPRLPFYEEQTYFESQGTDQQWELLAFGPAVQMATEGNVAIKV